MSRSYISNALRQQVYERAKGTCEYCLLPDSVALAVHQIDHVIAEKHGGKTQIDNLALSCVICNQNKGSDIASIDPMTTSIVTLYNPRQSRWSDHFRYEGAFCNGVTASGRATVKLLQINHTERIEERQILVSFGLRLNPP